MNFQISPLADIRSAIPLLADWHHQEWQHLNCESYDLSARISDYEQIAEANTYPLMFVAHKNGRPLGSARLIDNDMDTHPELKPWLASLFVYKEYRHKGIGSALIHQIENTAASLNFETIYLFTEDKQSIYKNQAWEVFANEIYYNEAVTIMRKHLNR